MSGFFGGGKSNLKLVVKCLLVNGLHEEQALECCYTSMGPAEKESLSSRYLRDEYENAR